MSNSNPGTEAIVRRAVAEAFTDALIEQVAEEMGVDRENLGHLRTNLLLLALNELETGDEVT